MINETIIIKHIAETADMPTRDVKERVRISRLNTLVKFNAVNGHHVFARYLKGLEIVELMQYEDGYCVDIEQELISPRAMPNRTLTFCITGDSSRTFEEEYSSEFTYPIQK